MIPALLLGLVLSRIVDARDTFICAVDAKHKKQAFTVQTGAYFMPVLASEVPGAQRRKAIVVIHGRFNTDQGMYFDSVNYRLKEHRLDKDIVVVAPGFPDRACNEQAWNGGSASHQLVEFKESTHQWTFGEDSDNENGVSSFQALDDVVTWAEKQYSIQEMIVTGFSAGGQMIQRWAIMSRHGTGGNTNGGIPLRIIAGSPSTYEYLGPKRPAQTCSPNEATGVKHTCKEFAEPQSGSRRRGTQVANTCGGTWNDYGYGLSGLQDAGEVDKSGRSTEVIVPMFKGRGCAKQAVNLGKSFSTVNACVDAARANANCGDAIMYPTGNLWNDWGCRCCSLGEDGSADENPKWDVYPMYKTVQLYEDVGCAEEAVNLGKSFPKVEDCAAAARANPACGDSIMYPKDDLWKSWGCRCCSQGKNRGTEQNEKWDVYHIKTTAPSASPLMVDMNKFLKSTIQGTTQYADAIPERFRSKDFWVCVGETDEKSCKDGMCAGNCASMVQGSNRLQRALNFKAHLEDMFPGYVANFRSFEAGHDFQKFFASPTFLDIALQSDITKDHKGAHGGRLLKEAARPDIVV